MERDLVRRVALVVGQDVTFCRNVIRGVRAYAIDKPHWLFRNGPPDTGGAAAIIPARTNSPRMCGPGVATPGCGI